MCREKVALRRKSQNADRQTAFWLYRFFAIEFVTFAIDFVPFAVEFVAFAVEFVPFASVLQLIPSVLQLICIRISRVCTRIHHNYINCKKPAAHHKVNHFRHGEYHLRHWRVIEAGYARSH